MIVINDGRSILKQIVSGFVCAVKLLVVAATLGFAWFTIWAISTAHFYQIVAFLGAMVVMVALVAGFILLESWSKSA